MEAVVRAVGIGSASADVPRRWRGRDGGAVRAVARPGELYQRPPWRCGIAPRATFHDLS